MKNEQKNKPRGHVFDGIEEYDNDLPRWWVSLFVLTVIFAFGYMAWYEIPFFGAPDLAQELDAVQQDAKAVAEATAKVGPEGFDYAGAAKDPATIAAGKATFGQTCASCHGAAGEGVIGPNLTDEFWLHGHRLPEIEELVNMGVPEKGMPSWRDILGPEKIRQVVLYIKTLSGTKPANGKAPQGTPGGLQL